MPMGDNLFAAKLIYLHKGSGCCKKKRKKVDKVDIIKNPSFLIFFFIERGYFDQKLPKESDKNGPDALQLQFLA